MEYHIVNQRKEVIQMTINERVRMLRKEKGLTQSELGEKIGLKKSAISKLESDGNSVTDQNIRLIRDTFHVREHWLRTGEGERDAGDDEALFEKIRERFRLRGLSETIARAWFRLPEEEREHIAQEVEDIAKRVQAGMPADGMTAAEAREAYKAQKHAELDRALALQEEEDASSSPTTSIEKQA